MSRRCGGVEVGRWLFLDDYHLHHRFYPARPREVLKRAASGNHGVMINSCFVLRALFLDANPKEFSFFKASKYKAQSTNHVLREPGGLRAVECFMKK